jgi:hypothetical protein
VSRRGVERQHDGLALCLPPITAVRHDQAMDLAVARTFVDRWVTAWNAHDLDSLLAHFAEDVVFTSPVAARLLPSSGGVVRGKTALREYWTEGLRRLPDLHFEIIATYIGVETLVINFRNQQGNLANEVLVFNGSLVVEGHGTAEGAAGERSAQVSESASFDAVNASA